MKQYTIGCIIFGIIFFLIGLFVSIAIVVAGGGAAILVGILLIIILGILPIYHGISEYKKDKRQNNKIIESKSTISNDNDNDIKKLINDYIERVVYNYNAQSQPRVSISKVKELFYSFCKDELKEYKTCNDVNNHHFGIIGITLICCNIIADITYQQLKTSPDTWNNAKDFFEEAIPETLKEDFLDTLDKTYIENIINLIDNCESDIFEKFNDEKEILDLLDYSLNFAQVFSLTVYNFSIINNLKLNEDGKIAIILFKCEVIITAYENPLPIKNLSCIKEVLDSIEKTIHQYDIDISKLEEQTHLLILGRCFNMLSSGDYHIHRGTLDTWIAPTILRVHKKCADWLLENKFFTQNEYDEHNKILEENIVEVG